MRKTSLLAAAVAMLILLPGRAPAVELPAGPIGDHVAAYLRAVNAPDEDAAKTLRERNVAKAFADSVPPGPFVRYFTNQRRVMGGLELVELRMTGPRAAELVLRDTIYGALHGLSLAFDDTPEARITAFEPGPAPIWAARPDNRLRARDIGAQSLALVDRGCRAGVFSGAVLVARGDEVLASRACGQANRRYGVQNTPATRLNLGSMNKMFTAVAVMQLVESGRLSLDDRLDSRLDETWLPREVSRRITIGQLLTHRSGLGSFLEGDFQNASRRLYRELDDYKPLVRGETPAFEPGAQFRYSDTGMLLLGAVIEKTTGGSYFDYVRDHVFQPAGMTDTGSWPMDEPVADLAMGYGWAPTTPLGWRENTFAHVFRGGPAGGGYSTVGDLHCFALALEAGRLISPASLAVLWTGGPPDNYGGGFMINASAAGRIVGHSGQFSGVSSRLEIYADKGYVVAILGNQDYAAPGLSDAIGALIAQAR